jgi:two-component system response regulator AtoC
MTAKLQVYGQLMSVAPIMHTFMETAARVARTEASILIRGQSGSGKELVARFIHEQSVRAAAPFYAVNCAALSRELMASELFGHKRGAFTGATHDRQGLLALADGGTLFLDEIAEMPLDIQAGLLRVLQERCFTPLGSSEPIQTDIRLVSATHESLRRRVAQGLFRGDLMYRVRVIPLYLPPLKERAGDVEMLLWHQLNTLNRTHERTVTAIAPKALQALLSYHWPGNVRELLNVATYAHAIGEGTQLRWQDLPPELRGEAPEDEIEEQPLASDLSDVQATLQRFGGNRTQAAEALGISRATLWRRLKSAR